MKIANIRGFSRFFLSIVILVVLALFPVRLWAQNASVPFLLPQTIFAGDSGRLVVPLDGRFAAVEPFVTENPAAQMPELVIRRIELERRGGASRLLIDFIPYAPGILAFPPLDFPVPGAETLTLSGLTVQVASILDPSFMALSEPAPPLAVPRTNLLIYGSVFAVLLLLFAGIVFSLWGRRNFRGFWQRLRRRHLLRAMMRFLRRLSSEGGLEKRGNSGYYLSLLAVEFREFLSVFTGVNCRSLSAGEFLELSLVQGEAGGETPPDSPLAPAFLCRLFRTWDTLRFSGQSVDRIDLFQALKETEKIIISLDRLEREGA